MKVKPITLTCADGRRLPLTIGRTYEVLGIEADYYRLLSDENHQPVGNDPVLCAPEYFEIVNSIEPEFWNCRYGEEGERYCYPLTLAQPGFFEDFHDGVLEAKREFWNAVRKYYPDTWNERMGK